MAVEGLEFFETLDRHLCLLLLSFCQRAPLVTHFNKACRASCLRIMQASRHQGCTAAR